GGQAQTGKAHKTTAVVLSWPAGTWLVGIAGAVVVGVGLWNLYRGVSRKFEDRWRTGEMGEQARKWGARAGLVGHVARAVVFALIGVFLVKAAIEFDPKDAIGLDGALRKLAHAGYGPYLLGLTAAGLVAYGLYLLRRRALPRRLRRLGGSDAARLARRPARDLDRDPPLQAARRRLRPARDDREARARVDRARLRRRPRHPPRALGRRRLGGP